MWYGTRHGLENIQHPKLKLNASTLPDLIGSAFSDSTLKKYKPAWKNWLKWSSEYPEVSTGPADPLYIAIYINELVPVGGKVGTIIAAYLGIRWGHLSAGVESPTENSFVKLALEGGKRILSKNTIRNKKEIITCDTLKKVIASFTPTNINLVQLRFIVLCLLGFSGFMRISELLSLKVRDRTFIKDGVKIFIEKSKTDQLRGGKEIILSTTGKPTYPIKWLTRYLDVSKLRDQSESFLFCRLAKTKSGHTLIGKYQISYTTALEKLRKHLPPGTNPKSIGTHSLRASGASEAANNGITDRMISKHGRWSTGKSQNRYIKDN